MKRRGSLATHERLPSAVTWKRGSLAPPSPHADAEKRCLSARPRRAGREPIALRTIHGPSLTSGKSLNRALRKAAPRAREAEIWGERGSSNRALRKAAPPPTKRCSRSCAGPAAAACASPKYMTSW